ncbi:MAG: dual specificity protein phosphatase family protein [Verrucomicrobia subdivision 3 bacterium]|nr:dual specificity protein phosphatase family protein [Limisphaerales bacterium]
MNEARQLHGEFDAVISVVSNPGSLKFAHPNHHREFFDDICEDFHWGREPRREQVERILEFVRKQPEGTRFLVHCQAGISRSTATALGVLAALGWDENEVVARLAADHPEGRPFWPNRLILQHFDIVLKTGLGAAANQFLAGQPDRLLGRLAVSERRSV